MVEINGFEFEFKFSERFEIVDGVLIISENVIILLIHSLRLDLNRY